MIATQKLMLVMKILSLKKKTTEDIITQIALRLNKRGIDIHTFCVDKNQAAF